MFFIKLKFLYTKPPRLAYLGKAEGRNFKHSLKVLHLMYKF